MCVRSLHLVYTWLSALAISSVPPTIKAPYRTNHSSALRLLIEYPSTWLHSEYIMRNYFHCQNSHGFSLRAKSETMLFRSPGNSFAYLSKSSLVFGLFRQVTPFWSCVKFFCPSHLPFGDECILPLSLSYDPLPLQNLASHNLASLRQSVVVLTVKIGS